MQRRTVLATAGTLAAIVSGCITDGTGGTETNGNGTVSPTPTQEDPEIEDRSFEVQDSGCGEGLSDATIRYDDRTVVVEGTIDGANGCYTAELDRATYDGEADRLTVVVVRVEQSPNGACVQCIIDIDYEARVSFEGELPGETVVRHDDAQVARDNRE